MKQRKYLKIFIIVAVVVVAAVIGLILRINATSEEHYKSLTVDYLTTKYGEGDWQIVSTARDTGYTMDGFVRHDYDKGYIFKVTSSYTNGTPFSVYIEDNDFITTDTFLPTYYSIKYGLDFTPVSDTDHLGDFTDLIDRMVFITDYHHPYNDYKYSSSGAIAQRPKAQISAFEMASFYRPISVRNNPVKEKVLDVIPDAGNVPDIREIISSAEEYYSSGLIKNQDDNDAELFALVFEQKADKETVVDFIKNHITPVAGYEPFKADYK